MAVEEEAMKGSEVGTRDVFSPRVGVCVTADVKVIQYGSITSFGPPGGAKCQIITSLNAVVKDISDTNDEMNTYVSQDLSEEFLEQPLVRRSKKNTQLNKISRFYSSNIEKKFQIERVVILPKIGCTTGKNTSTSIEDILRVKHSKSWEAVRMVPPELKEVGFLKARSMHAIKNKINTSSLKSDDRLNNGLKMTRTLKEPDMYESSTGSLQKENFPIESPNLDSDYDFEKELVTILKAPYDGETRNQYFVLSDTTISKVEKEKKAYVPYDLGKPKTTRNVSILHKPKTRDKSTSTTTLINGTSLYESLGGSLKGLLMPYTLAGKEFPSEIILKLTPKSEALKYVQTELSAHESKLADSSEMNLLAPKLNTVQKKDKKQSGLLSCLPFFRKKKGGDDDSVIAESLNSSTKEVYFPSVVEVYDDEKKTIKEVSSILTVNNSDHSNNKISKNKNTRVNC